MKRIKKTEHGITCALSRNLGKNYFFGEVARSKAISYFLEGSCFIFLHKEMLYFLGKNISLGNNTGNVLKKMFLSGRSSLSF